MCYNMVIMIPRSETAVATYRQQFNDKQAQKFNEREVMRLKALAKLESALPTIAVQYTSVQRLYLFGSVIRPGQFHGKSDVDIGITDTTAEDYFALWRTLEAELPEWFIDLRDVSDNSFFADSVQKTGLLIYERAS